jgi:hypothetical protein
MAHRRYGCFQPFAKMKIALMNSCYVSRSGYLTRTKISDAYSSKRPTAVITK